MIKFNLKPKAVWVSGANPVFDETELKIYTKEERKSIAFLINPYTPEMVKSLREKHRKKTEDNLAFSSDLFKALSSSGGDIDLEAMNEEVIDLVVSNWKGMVDENENALACNLENKKHIARVGYPILGSKWVEVARWVTSRYEKFMDEWERDQIKNLQSSQDGSETEVKI